MKNEKRKKYQSPKLIVIESYSGIRSVQEIFKEILLSELIENPRKIFALDDRSSIIKKTDNFPN